MIRLVKYCSVLSHKNYSVNIYFQYANLPSNDINFSSFMLYVISYFYLTLYFFTVRADQAAASTTTTVLVALRIRTLALTGYCSIHSAGDVTAWMDNRRCFLECHDCTRLLQQICLVCTLRKHIGFQFTLYFLCSS